MAEMGYGDAVRAAIAAEMEADASVVMFGEDIAHHGGMFRVSQGLLEQFGPKRVMDTPISESAFVGMALGAAMRGLKPIVELMFFDFSLVAMDQLLNQLAKTTAMSGGTVNIPLVIRTQGGGYKGAAAQHSQMLEALFLHIPGLKVVCPSTPQEAYSLLRAAIKDPNPVLFVEHKQLYGMKGEVDLDLSDDLNRARVVREGSDVSVFTYSYATHLALEAAEQLADEISVEVVDLRTLNPLDYAVIGGSLRKTHRVVVVHEAHARCGVGADLVAQIQEGLFDELDAPIARVCAEDAPLPFAQNLEAFSLPSVPRIVHAIHGTVE